MPHRFNPPPNWPQPPAGWKPHASWRPDPAWGPLPTGWQLWVDDQQQAAAGIDDGPVGRRVFISYRRSDCQAQANGLYDGLSHRLDNTSVFMDIDSIPVGVDFENHIRTEIEVCDVVLVLIGDNWLDRRPGSKTRRIDEENDFVRLEIESALASPRVMTVPVLVEGASMPSSSDLPKSIQRLARINAIEVDDRRWTSDLARLTHVLTSAVAVQEDQARRGASTASRPVAVVYPPPHSSPVGLTTQSVPVPPAPAAASWSVPAAPLPQPKVYPKAASPWASDQVGAVVALVPIFTCGLGAFAPGLRSGLQRSRPAKQRRRLLMFAAIAEVLVFISFGLIASGPEDSTGTPSGPVTDVGSTILILLILVCVVAGFVFRRPPPVLPGVEGEINRRERREEYRQLAVTDPGIARSIGVGRPDRHRNFDDGGLLDVNNLAAQVLIDAGCPVVDAHRLVERRSTFGSFSSVEEAVVMAEVSEPTASMLRDRAVAL